MARVKLARNLRWGGAPHARGDVLDVDDATAERWAENGLATPARGRVARQRAPGQLPEDFPGIRALREAGIGSFEDLREINDLTSILGIGEATAMEIRNALRD